MVSLLPPALKWAVSSWAQSLAKAGHRFGIEHWNAKKLCCCCSAVSVSLCVRQSPKYAYRRGKTKNVPPLYKLQHKKGSRRGKPGKTRQVQWRKQEVEWTKDVIRRSKERLMSNPERKKLGESKKKRHILLMMERYSQIWWLKMWKLLGVCDLQCNPSPVCLWRPHSAKGTFLCPLWQLLTNVLAYEEIHGSQVLRWQLCFWNPLSVGNWSKEGKRCRSSHPNWAWGLWELRRGGDTASCNEPLEKLFCCFLLFWPQRGQKESVRAHQLNSKAKIWSGWRKRHWYCLFNSPTSYLWLIHSLIQRKSDPLVSPIFSSVYAGDVSFLSSLYIAKQNTWKKSPPATDPPERDLSRPKHLYVIDLYSPSVIMPNCKLAAH